MSKITVISSFAKDDVYIRKRLISSKLAGPAHWITETLKTLHIPYCLTTGKAPAHVSITISNAKEKGEILSISPITLKQQNWTSTFIISTVKDEFDIQNIARLDGIIVLDVQGYIRSLKDGELLTIDPSILEKISILKGTASELNRLSPATIKSQKNRILIGTRGEQGGYIHYSKGKIEYRSRIARAEDTIGAGDTFLSAFTVKYLEAGDVQKSSDFALQYTYSFLSQKAALDQTPDKINGMAPSLPHQKHQIQKKIALVISTHGNEPLGRETVKLLTKKKHLIGKFDFVVGNPVAENQNKRFIDADLNRVAPGNKRSSLYEERRAHELIQFLKKYTYVLDIHQTRANDRAMVILPKVTFSVLNLTEAIDINTILIWPNRNQNVGAMTSFLPNAVGIEVGNKSGYGDAVAKTARVIEKFIRDTDKGMIISTKSNKTNNKNYYYVYDEINPADVKGVVLKDFMEIRSKNKTFTTLLFGRHRKILGYKMKRVNRDWVIKHHISPDN